jgi:hypothetical protein
MSCTFSTRHYLVWPLVWASYWWQWLHSLCQCPLKTYERVKYENALHFHPLTFFASAWIWRYFISSTSSQFFILNCNIQEDLKTKYFQTLKPKFIRWWHMTQISMRLLIHLVWMLIYFISEIFTSLFSRSPIVMWCNTY